MKKPDKVTELEVEVLKLKMKLNVIATLLRSELMVGNIRQDKSYIDWQKLPGWMEENDV